jgi:hypothetical protein
MTLHLSLLRTAMNVRYLTVVHVCNVWKSGIGVSHCRFSAYLQPVRRRLERNKGAVAYSDGTKSTFDCFRPASWYKEWGFCVESTPSQLFIVMTHLYASCFSPCVGKCFLITVRCVNEPNDALDLPIMQYLLESIASNRMGKRIPANM